MNNLSQNTRAINQTLTQLLVIPLPTSSVLTNDQCLLKPSTCSDHESALQDITPVDDIRQNPKCDREIAVYGYLRGTKLKGNARVHIAGVGDATVSPCGTVHAVSHIANIPLWLLGFVLRF